MTKRILPMIALATLTGCQAPQLGPLHSASTLPYRTQNDSSKDQHHEAKEDEHQFRLVPEAPAAHVNRLVIRPAASQGVWDTARAQVESLDTPGLTGCVVLVKDVTLRPVGSSYVAKGALLAKLPPGRYRCSLSLWKGGTSGLLVGEDQQTLQLVPGHNALDFSPVDYPFLGLLGVAPASASAGATVSLIGQGFSVLADQNRVTLGGQAVQVVSATSTRLTVVTPALPPGSYIWWVQVGCVAVGRAGFLITGP